MDAQKLVAMAMDKSGLTSTRKLGERLGVSHVTVSQWMNGTNCPTFEYAAELAELAGLPALSTAAEVRQHSPDGAKHKALLRRIATMAAMVALTAGIAPAHAETHFEAHNSGTLYIMSNYRLTLILAGVVIHLTLSPSQLTMSPRITVSPFSSPSPFTTR